MWNELLSGSANNLSIFHIFILGCRTMVGGRLCSSVTMPREVTSEELQCMKWETPALLVLRDTLATRDSVPRIKPYKPRIIYEGWKSIVKASPSL